ncbi:helix-turn-helix domain-containing protein [Sphingomonas sp.]|uniref:arsenate reductase/protein-tyrosine-phosphatase family protein n=1 Tax=Sphingomonas sp. TaxID=28214 RepID=UPI0035B08FA7
MEFLEAASAFGALSVDTRLKLMRLLMEAGPSGLPAGDLAAGVGLSSSNASFHLAALERAGLTQATRQGRQIIHAARIAGLRRLLGFLTETCCGGRPELCGDLARLLPPWPEEDQGMTAAFNVLFLCTHNSARSIMAEAILQKQGGRKFRAYSAGSDPIAQPNPEVIAKLLTLGHDTDQLRSKSWDEFTGPNAPQMDFVITLCDTPHGQQCPDFGGVAVTGAWPLPDPSKFTGSDVERAALLNELYASLRRRIEMFAALPFASLDRMALKARLDELAGGTLPARVAG